MKKHPNSVIFHLLCMDGHRGFGTWGTCSVASSWSARFLLVKNRHSFSVKVLHITLIPILSFVSLAYGSNFASSYLKTVHRKVRRAKLGFKAGGVTQHIESYQHAVVNVLNAYSDRILKIE